MTESHTNFVFSLSSTIDPMPTPTPTQPTVNEAQKEDVATTVEKEEENIISTHTQTYNPPLKDRGMRAIPSITKECASQASKWIIHDAYGPYEKDNPKKEKEKEKEFKKKIKWMERDVTQNSLKEKQMLYKKHSEDMMEGDEMMISESVDMNEEELTIEETEDEISVEKAKPIEEGEKEKVNTSPHLELLFSFKCEESEGFPCGVLIANPLNNDLIVGGYGESGFGHGNKGKIMFWTLKNPKSPERIYKTESSVVSMDFSLSHPSLLGVGLFNGMVHVYDIREKSLKPILKSELGSSKHSSPVWDILWERPSFLTTALGNDGSELFLGGASDPATPTTSSSNLERNQKLYSISSDGDIKEWTMKKGFLGSNIMQLSRVPNLAAPKGTSVDNTIKSRQGSGLCFDFPFGKGGSQYFVGTEDGIAHKCSISYNEQVLKTYYGHTGAIYKIHSNPFDNSKFMTSSKDWTIKIWEENTSKPILDLSPGNTAVKDIKWSPFDSCVFASASSLEGTEGGGLIHIWDLTKNKKDPIFKHIVKNGKDVHTILFPPKTPSLLAGLGNGQINVYRINNLNTSPHFNIFGHFQRLHDVLQTEE